MPFTFMSPEEWHNQHIPPDEREPAVRGSQQKIVSVIESLSQSLLKASSLRGLRYTDLTRLLHRTASLDNGQGSGLQSPQLSERLQDKLVGTHFNTTVRD
jgi:hypothetical protein